ncbi:methyltransferase domain-containing protein [Spirulina subsalsa]|uniref:spermine/spermidine synthase domain-containing protein n=1 Tax=Spirulina subsalsa TaxID=54311 RepID=UPI0002D975E6|nr:methyltransferase domain-containing protein [Spirulina subsalsa]
MAGSELKADAWIKEYITPWDVYEHGITQVFAYKKTQYQEMFIVETGVYGKALVLDGKWQTCTGDEFLYHEPLIHPAFICHGSPKKALVLGGGDGAAVREILRWNTIERVVMVDIDGDVVNACKEHLVDLHQNSFSDPRLELIIGDAVAYLENCSEQWDVVVSDLSDAIEDGPSFALFTQEYFEKIKNVLAPNGYFVIQAGAVSVGELGFHANLVNTVKTIFSSVVSYCSPVPTYGAPWGFALASNQPINTRPEPEEVDRLLAEKTKGGFRLIDGITLLGLMQTPSYIRRAITDATEVFTLKNPPKWFGKGVTK